MTSVTPNIVLIRSSPIALWGIDSQERLRRAFKRAGIAVTGQSAGGGVAGTEQPTLLIRADHVYEESVIRALIRNPSHLLVTDAGVPVAAHIAPGGDIDAAAALLQSEATVASGALPAGLSTVVDPAALASTYNHALRKRARPYVLPLTPETVPAIEHRMFHGAYKGVTDFVTKYVWPVPAMAVTRWCARLSISPNMVTTVSFLCVLAAMSLFWHGQFLAGLAAAWMMCFLDTVDGKLARVTLTSTKFGDVFDHGIDLLHPPFWYYAWFVGQGAVIGGSGQDALQTAALWIIIAGYVLGRGQEGLFIWLYRIEIHTWRPIDSWFRLITARRNPNLFILTIAALIDRPAEGFLAVAAWTIVSFLFHCWRIAQAGWQRMMGHRPCSWLTEPLVTPEAWRTERRGGSGLRGSGVP
ncbi:CDP-alcohol phosphatidyltransferase family protein [Dongia soli]|uniref:CDP-alcohol phosphatidyltransferase family protein n=1 Tax=Dongia soli TaxID=600628 RepID=A0ABU5EAY0_9PROT|nr:CDP-alcohol phosphatidyltransferase family protein [Dongia soli]MDY0883140.1 CDP-alcohol phosphatidyltransferase family protein [Dongia soli]